MWRKNISVKWRLGQGRAGCGGKIYPSSGGWARPGRMWRKNISVKWRLAKGGPDVAEKYILHFFAVGGGPSVTLVSVF